MADLSRRGFLGGILAACAAPAIISTPGLIMPIKPGIFFGIRPLTIEEFSELYVKPAMKILVGELGKEFVPVDNPYCGSGVSLVFSRSAMCGVA